MAECIGVYWRCSRSGSGASTNATSALCACLVLLVSLLPATLSWWALTLSVYSKSFPDTLCTTGDPCSSHKLELLRALIQQLNYLMCTTSQPLLSPSPLSSPSPSSSVVNSAYSTPNFESALSIEMSSKPPM